MIVQQDVNLEEFETFCKIAGIDPPCISEKTAIRLATRGAANKTLLEVGSGYGRLAPFLIEMCAKRGVKLSFCEPDPRYTEKLARVATGHELRVKSVLDITERHDVVLAPFTFLMLFPHQEQLQILEHMLLIGKRVAIDISFPCENEAYILEQEIILPKRKSSNTAFIQPFVWYKDIAIKHKRNVRFLPYFQRNWSWLHLYVIFD